MYQTLIQKIEISCKNENDTLIRFLKFKNITHNSIIFEHYKSH